MIGNTVSKVFGLHICYLFVNWVLGRCEVAYNSQFTSEQSTWRYVIVTNTLSYATPKRYVHQLRQYSSVNTTDGRVVDVSTPITYLYPALFISITNRQLSLLDGWTSREAPVVEENKSIVNLQVRNQNPHFWLDLVAIYSLTSQNQEHWSHSWPDSHNSVSCNLSVRSQECFHACAQSPKKISETSAFECPLPKKWPKSLW